MKIKSYQPSLINHQLPEKGQIALIVLLIMVVVLTVGLSVASRSVTDVSLSTSKEAGIRAFNAAEAGIEEALSRASLAAGSFGVTVGDITADVEVEEVKSVEALVERNDVLEVNLAGATTSNVKISWVKGAGEDPGCNDGEGGTSAVEIIRWREESSGNIIAQRYLYNAYSCSSLNSTNGFQSAFDPGGGDFLSEITSFPVDGDPAGGYDRALRIRPIYNKATILVEAVLPGELPSQQYEITSEAITKTGESRVVQVTRSVPALPAVFDYALFSGTDLVHD